MRPFGDLTPKEEALRILLAAAPRVPATEVIPLLAARGRVAGEDVHAPVAVPPFDRATMDGYAVRVADGARLRVAGDAFAGALPPPLRAGEAMRIATGAPVPPGADAVVRVEDTSETGGIVQLQVAAQPGRSIERIGNDIILGARVVAAGDVLTPARLGLLASLGIATARVRARPRVTVLTTGDELLAPGEAPQPGRIFDANATSLAAVLEEAGGDVRKGARVPDDPDAHRRALRDAASASDLVVLSGGASVGARDLVVDALRAEDATLLLHGVRVKPGKPLLAATMGRALVVGLPGNPTSALSNAALFVAPALRQMAGLPQAAARTVEAGLAIDVEGEKDRYLFLPVRVEGGHARPTFKGSGALTSMAGSDGWIGVPEGVTLRAGTRVVVTLW